jgi:hypothetical protein
MRAGTLPYPLVFALTCVLAHGSDGCTAHETSPSSASRPAPSPVEDARLIVAYSYRLGGLRRTFSTTDPDWFRHEEASRTNIAALTDQAARDLGCAPESVSVVERVKTEVFTARGCDRNSIYLLVYRGGWTTHAEGFAGRRVLLSVVGFVPLVGGDPDAALQDIDQPSSPEDPKVVAENQLTFEVPERERLPARTLAEARSKVADWMELSKAGARDLKCPREQVFVEIRPTGRSGKVPMAEGCGQRATYLFSADGHGYDLSSLVAVARSE